MQPGSGQGPGLGRESTLPAWMVVAPAAAAPRQPAGPAIMTGNGYGQSYHGGQSGAVPFIPGDEYQHRVYGEPAAPVSDEWRSLMHLTQRDILQLHSLQLTLPKLGVAMQALGAEVGTDACALPRAPGASVGLVAHRRQGPVMPQQLLAVARLATLFAGGAGPAHLHPRCSTARGAAARAPLAQPLGL